MDGTSNPSLFFLDQGYHCSMKHSVQYPAPSCCNLSTSALIESPPEPQRDSRSSTLWLAALFGWEFKCDFNFITKTDCDAYPLVSFVCWSCAFQQPPRPETYTKLLAIVWLVFCWVSQVYSIFWGLSCFSSSPAHSACNIRLCWMEHPSKCSSRPCLSSKLHRLSSPLLLWLHGCSDNSRLCTITLPQHLRSQTNCFLLKIPYQYIYHTWKQALSSPTAPRICKKATTPRSANSLKRQSRRKQPPSTQSASFSR